MVMEDYLAKIREYSKDNRNGESSSWFVYEMVFANDAILSLACHEGRTGKVTQGIC